MKGLCYQCFIHGLLDFFYKIATLAVVFASKCLYAWKQRQEAAKMAVLVCFLVILYVC